MQILCHRGWWLSADEKNTSEAFSRAFAAGLGVETDVRDYHGELVISHDIVGGREGEAHFSLDNFLALYSDFGASQMLALNIKADGLAEPLIFALAKYSVTNYFVFDMSVPDSLSYFDRNASVFTRRSEFEAKTRLEKRATGVWFDAFEEAFVTPSDILPVIKMGKLGAIVSPELHRRPYEMAWDIWRDAFHDLTRPESDRLFLCTDFPREAREKFGPLCC